MPTQGDRGLEDLGRSGRADFQPDAAARHKDQAFGFGPHAPDPTPFTELLELGEFQEVLSVVPRQLR